MSPSFLEALQSGMEISAPFNFSMKSSSGTGKSGDWKKWVEDTSFQSTQCPANIYLFKVNHRNRKRCKICLKLTIEILGHISHTFF